MNLNDYNIDNIKDVKLSDVNLEEYSDELEHAGIKGMKWGQRRYQNPDGSLTPLGRKHYGKEAAKKVKPKTTAVKEAKPKKEKEDPTNFRELRRKNIKKMTDAELKRYKERMDLENNAKQAKTNALAAKNKLKQEKRAERKNKAESGVLARLGKRLAVFSSISTSVQNIMEKVTKIGQGAEDFKDGVKKGKAAIKDTINGSKKKDNPDGIDSNKKDNPDGINLNTDQQHKSVKSKLMADKIARAKQKVEEQAEYENYVNDRNKNLALPDPGNATARTVVEGEVFGKGKSMRKEEPDYKSEDYDWVDGEFTEPKRKKKKK